MPAAARFLAPLALMALIWALSSQPDPAPDLGALQGAAAVLGHLASYAALWTLFSWAMRFRRPLVALALTVGYGVVDEIHQSFVPGRDATAFDVGVDAAGAALAWALTSWACRRLARDRVSSYEST